MKITVEGDTKATIYSLMTPPMRQYAELVKAETKLNVNGIDIEHQSTIP